MSKSRSKRLAFFYVFGLVYKQKKMNLKPTKVRLHLLPIEAIIMILLNQEKIKIFEYNNCKKIIDEKLENEKIEELVSLINEYESEENYEYIECPCCKSDRLIRYGSYKRNIGIFGKYYEIKIKRVQCKNCNHTHALIPSFIMPYFQNEVSFIVLGITLRELEEEKITEVSENLSVTRQLMYFWIRRFKSHLTRLKTTFSYALKEIMIFIFDGIKMRKKYQIINKLRFLEKVPT